MIIIIKRGQDENLRVFEVSESQFEEFKVESIQSQISSSKADAISIYKMEYERCAQRYDDLYKAAWTNFSYIALVAGAILTFGRESFMTELSIFLATLPLLFWWIATFEPLNRYGDQVAARAMCIEKLLNGLVRFGPAEKLSERQKKEEKCQEGLQHFQDFERRKFDIRLKKFFIGLLFWGAINLIVLQRLFALSDYIDWLSLPMIAILLIIWIVVQYRDAPTRLFHIFRVRFIVRTLAGAIFIIAVCSAYGAYRRHQTEPYLRSTSSKAELKLPERLNIKIEE